MGERSELKKPESIHSATCHVQAALGPSGTAGKGARADACRTAPLSALVQWVARPQVSQLAPRKSCRQEQDLPMRALCQRPQLPYRKRQCVSRISVRASSRHIPHPVLLSAPHEPVDLLQGSELSQVELLDKLPRILRSTGPLQAHFTRESRKPFRLTADWARPALEAGWEFR